VDAGKSVHEQVGARTWKKAKRAGRGLTGGGGESLEVAAKRGQKGGNDCMPLNGT